jgi:hypothetical protein
MHAGNALDVEPLLDDEDDDPDDPDDVSALQGKAPGTAGN